ncbi:MAG: beta-ketoacyl synthase chain length factor [Chitinophagaceae bacterium]
MKQPLYIKAAVAISPQESFEDSKFLKPIITSNNGKLFAIDAAYQQYISPVAIRRMSRIMKMTISCAMEALKRATVATPDAIITGTGRGGVTDMEHFVKDMIRLEEGAMNPTAFIQSTYNSPNGWIAMQSKCTGYNQTYVHRGSSFELALQDAQMLAAETKNPINILVGCFDELTEDYYHIRRKRGYWKNPAVASDQLYKHPELKGTIAGEGTTFFVLSNQKEGTFCEISNLKIVYRATAEIIANALQELLSEENLRVEDIDIALVGENGDSTQALLYEGVSATLEGVPTLRFKHLCGEFDTASGFATWYAAYLLAEEKSPALRRRNLVLINHYILGSASLIFLKKTSFLEATF